MFTVTGGFLVGALKLPSIETLRPQWAPRAVFFSQDNNDQIIRTDVSNQSSLKERTEIGPPKTHIFLGAKSGIRTPKSFPKSRSNPQLKLLLQFWERSGTITCGRRLPASFM